jgi:hypothetical protein
MRRTTSGAMIRARPSLTPCDFFTARAACTALSDETALKLSEDGRHVRHRFAGG